MPEEIAIHPNEPKRVTFTEAKLPGEPDSDVQLTIPGGMKLRERVVRTQSDHGSTFRFTHTRLTASGEVMFNDAGEPLITFPHELCLQGEEAARLGQAGVAEALKREREVAAARARDFFSGLVMIDKVLSGRV